MFADAPCYSWFFCNCFSKTFETITTSSLILKESEEFDRFADLHRDMCLFLFEIFECVTAESFGIHLEENAHVNYRSV